MSMSTQIGWCDSTINPTAGCDGCPLFNPKTGVVKCYAAQLHQRRGGITKGYSPRFQDVTFHPGRTDAAARWSDLRGLRRATKPWLDGLPRAIFVSDMSDALSRDVPFPYLKEQIIDVAADWPGNRHQWLWLTKRPERMAEFSCWLKEQNGVDWPENVWAGLSILQQQDAGRIDALLGVGDERTIRFLSIEPLWQDVDLTPWLPRVDWAIVGGESNTEAREFEIDWAEHLRQQCSKARTAYFVKQLGSNVLQGGESYHLKDKHGLDVSAWPRSLRVRQMPIHVGSPTKGIRQRQV